MAADVAEGGVAHHVRELLVERARGSDGRRRHLIPGQRLALAVPVAMIVAVAVAISIRLHRRGSRGRRHRFHLRHFRDNRRAYGADLSFWVCVFLEYLLDRRILDQIGAAEIFERRAHGRRSR